MMRLLISLVLIYLLVMALMWAFQGRLLYQPGTQRDYAATPGQYGMDWQRVALETADGVRLDAWWLPRPQSRATMLFLHGNAGNISHRLASLEQFHRLGLSVLILDYRGYGRSEGRPSEAGTALDARAGWSWLRREQGLQADELIIFGRSLGAAVAAELAREVTPGALILESPFRSVPLMAGRLYPFLPARLLARFDYATVDYVRQVEAPVLVIHSRDDEIIPFSEGQAVHEAAPEPKQFLPIRGGHNSGFLESEETYLDGIERFLTDAGMTKQ